MPKINGFEPVRVFVLAVASFFAANLDQATAAPLVAESFSYTSGDLVGQGGWSQVGTGSAGPVQVINSTSDYGGSLAYPGLAASSGNRLELRASQSQYVQTHGGIGTQATDVFVYASFLAKVTELPSGTSNAGVNFACFKDSWDYTARSLVWFLDAHPSEPLSPPEIKFGIGSANGPSVLSTSVPLNTTNLLVIAYNPVTGVAKMWVNPDRLEFGAKSAPTTDMNYGFALTNLPEGVQYFCWHQWPGFGTGALEVDELRVGLSWADVTPRALTSCSKWSMYR